MSIKLNKAEKEPDLCSTKTISQSDKDKILYNLNKIPMFFITNDGQIDQKVKYYAKGGDYGFYFTKEEVVLSFVKRTSKEISDKSTSKGDISKEEEKEIGVVLSMQFIDANSDVKIEGQIRGSGRVNYIKGNDPEKWYTDLSTYEQVVYKDLWQGIDLVFYGGNDQLKYEFIVHPGSDIEDIKLSYRGADGISLDKEGNLLIKIKLGVLIDERPISYQDIDGRKVAIDSRFAVNVQENRESIYSFDIENGYNLDYPIIIDPGLIYSTYLGGTGDDRGNGIAIDNTGNAYVTGETGSANFPTTAGAFQPGFGGGGGDAFVTKLNAGGTGLIYSTYLGGSSTDGGFGIAVDNTGSAYVTGSTFSLNYPTTAGAFQTTIDGFQNAFVTKLNATGSGLIYSTYLGGGSDTGFGIAVDNNGNTYVTGQTASANFPTTAGAFQTIIGGDFDAFVTKLNAAGSGLIYSTYLGGSSTDIGNAIAIDNAGNAYVTGLTSSVNFPTTAGAFQPGFGGGGGDAFVTKLNAGGTGLIYSTYLGGSSTDGGFGIAVDNTSSAYVTGATFSLNYPTTAGAFQTTIDGFQNAFVTKLNAAGSGLIYSTYLGGGSDTGFGIAVDNNGNTYVTGQTASANFPTTAGAFQTIIGGDFDAFVTKLNAAGSGLIYSTYLGGSSTDIGNAIAVDNTGSAFVTGRTASGNFPTTFGAFQTALGGASDAFASKINTNPPIPPIIRITNQNITAIIYEAG